MERTRPSQKILQGRPTTDGAGVKLTRLIASPDLPDLDPFLLLDEFRSENPEEYAGGFPPHPHRGFETVTYLLAGHFRHRDSRGNEGLLVAGSLQWMTAGRGLVHSEMPEQEEGLLWGFQLWVNLPAPLKFADPRYQDIPPERIPAVEREGARVRVLAGEWAKTRGPAETHHPVEFLDVTLEPGAVFRQPCPPDRNAFLYAFEGEVALPGEKRLGKGSLAVLGEGEAVEVRGGPLGARFLFGAGKRLEEPVARAGPFVMNTEAELRRAFADYQEGRLG